MDYRNPHYAECDIDPEGKVTTTGTQLLAGRTDDDGSGDDPDVIERTPHTAATGGLQGVRSGLIGSRLQVRRPANAILESVIVQVVHLAWPMQAGPGSCNSARPECDVSRGASRMGQRTWCLYGAQAVLSRPMRSSTDQCVAGVAAQAAAMTPGDSDESTLKWDRLSKGK